MKLKLKVCGMREQANIRELAHVGPDLVGMIFYPKSSRFVGENEWPDDFPDSISKVGVFVDADEQEILGRAQRFGFSYVQLHGSEPPQLAANLRGRGFRVIKVFGVTDELPMTKMQAFESCADFFLFDTKAPGYGGSGKKFDWKILQGYDLSKPFFLSGGIDLDDIEEIKQLRLKALYGIDINSRFELRPGLKDIQKIKELKVKL